MKTKIAVTMSFLLLLAMLAMTSCRPVGSSMNGTGKIVDQDVEITDFASISAKGVYSLVIRESKTFKVTVSLDDNLFKRLKITRERKSLNLDIEAPATFFPTSLVVTVLMPKLNSLSLSGGAKADIQGFKSPEDFTAFVKDKGSLVGSIDAGKVFINLTESSTVVLSGSGLNLELNAVGGSQLDMRRFLLTRAQVKMNEGAEAILDVSGQIDVDLKNKSKLYFSGNPIFTNTSVTGDSTMSMVAK